MITLKNGHKMQYVVASGALAFDGKGWWFERIFLWLGLIQPKLFTIVLKTLTFDPREGNLKWWKPWTCIRHLWRYRGVINKVGLTNPGFRWWCEKMAPKIERSGLKVIVSIYGTQEELVAMARILNRFRFIVGIEINVSCPNTGHAMADAAQVVESVKFVKAVSRHSILAKLSVGQPYIQIAKLLKGYIDAVSLNSVPEQLIFPKGWRNPLHKLIAKVGDGGGGISGKPAQELNWKAVKEIVEQVPGMPVIAPSIMEYGDLVKVDALGAQAYSFGAIHLYGPWKPTSIVRRHMAETQARGA